MPDETSAPAQPSSYTEFLAMTDKPVEAPAETGTVEEPKESEVSAETSDESPSADEETVEESEPSDSQVQDPKVAQRIKKLLKERLEVRKENEKLLRQIAESAKLAGKPADRAVTPDPPSAKKDWYADDDPKAPKPKQADFKNWEDFSDAAADWRAGRTLEKLKFEQQQAADQEIWTREVTALNTGYETRLKAAPERDEIVKLTASGTEGASLWFPNAVADYIKASENGPALFLKLLQDKAAHKAVTSSRHPALQWAAMQKLEASFKPAKVPAKTVTSAPKPVTVLGGRSTPTGASKPEDAKSKEEFNRLMDRRRAG